MKPLPRAASGTVVSLDADLYNFLADNLERMDKWVVKPPLNLQQTPAGNLLSLAPIAAAPLALVMIIGIETGGGRYQGSILSGNSSGSTSNNFQLEPTITHSYTDGPATTLVSGAAVNNALVINTQEPYVNGTHLLYNANQPYYAVGKIMGQTSESTPRTIVYIDNWPIQPVIAKITGTYVISYGGVYRGEIVRGQFPTSNSFSVAATTEFAGGITGAENCWIVNTWEQSYIPSSDGNALGVGTYVMGFMCGFPTGADPGGTLTNDSWYMVYTMTPPRSAAVSITTPTGVTATDIYNLYTQLSALYSNLRAAGYSL
jgi:hypothetical protein